MDSLLSSNTSDNNMAVTPNTYNECIEIIEDKKKLNHNDLSHKWELFKKRFPQLYEMLTLNDNLDLNLLKFLCDTAEKQMKLSKEEQLETDFNIGDRLAKEFIYDKFPEPSQEQKEFIKETLRKKINSGTEFKITK